MSWVAGIDGCRAGWVVVLVEHTAGVVRNHHITLCPSFADVLAIHQWRVRGVAYPRARTVGVARAVSFPGDAAQ